MLSQQLKNPWHKTLGKNHHKATTVSTLMMLGCWFRNRHAYLLAPSNPLLLNLYYVEDDIYSNIDKMSIICICD